jgi:hypothetical protein
MFTDNYSTRNAQVTHLLNGQIRREAAMNANGGILPLERLSLRQKRTQTRSSG